MFFLPAGRHISKERTLRVSDMKILSLQSVVPDIQSVENCAFLITNVVANQRASYKIENDIDSL